MCIRDRNDIRSKSRLIWWSSAVNRSCFLNLAAWRTRSSACDTRARHCVRFVLCWFAFPSAPALGSTGSAAVLLPALFVGFPATLARSDFLGSFIIGFGSSPSRCGPVVLSGQTQDLPVPIRRACAHARVSDHAEPGGRSRCRLRSYCFPRQRPCLRSEQESFSRLYGWPVRTPVNASPPPSRTTAHDSGPLWFATPSVQWTLTTYSSPVSPAHLRSDSPSAPPACGTPRPGAAVVPRTKFFCGTWG